MAFVGEIALCLSSLYIPEGWYELNGGTIPESSPLAELLGTTTLPDWSNRVPVQHGNMIDPGETQGSATKTLEIENLPSHAHAQRITDTQDAGFGTGSNALKYQWALTGDSSAGAILTHSVGSGGAFSLMQPSVGACYIIYGGQVSLSMEESLAIIAANSAKEPIIELNGVRILSTTAVVDF